MTKKYILALFLFLAVIIVSYLVQQNTVQVRNVYNDSGQYEIKEIKETDGYRLQAYYPVTSHEVLNKAIEERINKEVTTFKNEVQELKDSMLSGELSQEITFDIYDSDPNVISIAFHLFTYLGGAHPSDQTITINYQIKENKIVTIDSLIEKNPDILKKVSAYSYEMLKKEERIQKYSDDAWIKRGLETNKDNYEVFAIERDNIIFFYNRYQVGPYVSGVFKVAVPNTVIKVEL